MLDFSSFIIHISSFIFQRLTFILMKIINFLLYGNFFIALCAYSQTVQTCRFLGDDNISQSVLPIFVAAATFFLYNIHKPITFFLKKQLLDNQRFLKTKSFSTPLSILTILAGLFCLYFFFNIKTATQLSLLVAAFFSLAYVLPVFRGKRLRDLPFVKIFTIAFVWAFVTVILPVQEYGNILDSYVKLMFLERVLFVFSLTIPFDIRDIDVDIQTNVKTIPLSIGVQKAKYLGILALIGCVFIVFVLNMQGVYSFKNTIALLLTYIISILVVGFTRKSRSDYYYYGLTDGMMLLQGLFFFLLTVIL